MPVINGQEWTKEEVHKALKEGRVEDIWPGARFDDHCDWGRLWFADGSRVKINFDPHYKG